MLTSSTLPAGSAAMRLCLSQHICPGNGPDASEGRSGTARRQQETNFIAPSRWVYPDDAATDRLMTLRESPTIPAGREAIAGLAYLFYLQDGSPDGKDMEHWLQAELFLSNLAG